MGKNEIYGIARDALNESELRSSDIPPIDLYVDQILSLMSEKVSHGSERYHDKVLTKTMINNYSKDGLITPVNGKKYTKEQILQMLTVYTLKGTLSIGEIKRILDGAYSSESFDGEALRLLYDKHIQIKQTNGEYALQTLEGIVDRNGLDLDNDVDYISAICAITAYSAQLKNMAQALIDARFPEPPTPDEEKRAEKERRRKEEEEKAEEERRREEEKKAEKERRKEEEKRAELERKKEKEKK